MPLPRRPSVRLHDLEHDAEVQNPATGTHVGVASHIRAEKVAAARARDEVNAAAVTAIASERAAKRAGIATGDDVVAKTETNERIKLRLVFDSEVVIRRRPDGNVFDARAVRVPRARPARRPRVVLG